MTVGLVITGDSESRSRDYSLLRTSLMFSSKGLRQVTILDSGGGVNIRIPVNATLSNVLLLRMIYSYVC